MMVRDSGNSPHGAELEETQGPSAAKKRGGRAGRILVLYNKQIEWLNGDALSRARVLHRAARSRGGRLSSTRDLATALRRCRLVSWRRRGLCVCFVYRRAERCGGVVDVSDHPPGTSSDGSCVGEEPME